MAGRNTKPMGLAEMMKGAPATTSQTRRTDTPDLDLRKFDSVGQTQEFIEMLTDGGWGCLAAQIVNALNNDMTGETGFEKGKWLTGVVAANAVPTPFLQRWSVPRNGYRGMWTMLSDRSVIHLQDRGPDRGIMVRAYLQMSLLPDRNGANGGTPLVRDGEESACAAVVVPDLIVTNGKGGGMACFMSQALGCEIPDGL